MLIFDFNSSERRGLLVLAILVVLSIAFRFSLPYFNQINQTDFTKFKNEIKEFELNQKEYAKKIAEEKLAKQEKYKNYNKYNTYSNYENHNKKAYYKKNKKIKYFNLNPNTASISDWKKFGFSEKQSKVICNYIKKSGGISEKSELKNIFVINDKKYKEISPYIIINKDYISNPVNNSYNYKKVEIIELNSATKQNLVSISGIGETFANRIIKYRNYLGGFYSKEQLKEVYGIKPEIFEKIKDFISVNEYEISTINVNFTNEKDLSKHPYISYKDAKAIVNYRTKNGFIKNIDILFEENIITNKKLKYYIVSQD